MKKFARCVLILILVAVLSGVGGYIYENNTKYRYKYDRCRLGIESLF